MRTIHRFLGLVLVGLCGAPAFAADCFSAPQGFGGGWAREYKAWCEACCGTYSAAGPSCSPGSNWGCGGGAAQGGTGQSTYDSSADDAVRQEAARKRRQEAERRRRDEAAAEAARRSDFERQRDEISKSMKGISDNELGLKELSSDELRELKDAPVSSKAASTAKHAPPDFPAIEGLERSPGYEAWRRGMQAVVVQDWQLALAWFKTAQQKDPLNPVLSRAVGLADWTWESRKRAAIQASKSANSGKATGSAIRSPRNEDLELLFFPKPARPQGSLQVPEEKDLEFLFVPDEREEELIQLLFPGHKRRAPVKIDPDWRNPQVSAAARTAYADELAAQALLLVDKGDYNGAIGFLMKADKQAPHIENYRRTARLVQQWVDQKK
jgi:hypothetical protein